ncbi:hypothetical protein TNCV_1123161 [Trichonephila clavipes]|uniref:Uncharacterized protein n=1 Tax=Trichonephila clavipes TaxID=2585209 RepID=A0A8X6VKA0_TRICX|nr:hypothetical protein TNCV_1123161 [Trichonephila clavipes]
MTLLQDTIDKFKDTSIIKNSHDVIKKVDQQEVFSVNGFDFEDLFNSIKIEDIIQEVPATAYQNVWFIHDGTPVPFSVVVRNHLLAWSPCSLDLKSLDFYFLGRLKSLVYETPSTTVKDLVVFGWAMTFATQLRTIPATITRRRISDVEL